MLKSKSHSLCSKCNKLKLVRSGTGERQRKMKGRERREVGGERSGEVKADEVRRDVRRLNPSCSSDSASDILGHPNCLSSSEGLKGQKQGGRRRRRNFSPLLSTNTLFIKSDPRWFPLESNKPTVDMWGAQSTSRVPLRQGFDHRISQIDKSTVP